MFHGLVWSVFILPAEWYKNLIRYFKTEIPQTNLGYNLAIDPTGLGDRLNVRVWTQTESRASTKHSDPPESILPSSISVQQTIFAIPTMCLPRIWWHWRRKWHSPSTKLTSMIIMYFSAILLCNKHLQELSGTTFIALRSVALLGKLYFWLWG